MPIERAKLATAVEEIDNKLITDIDIKWEGDKFESASDNGMGQLNVNLGEVKGTNDIIKVAHDHQAKGADENLGTKPVLKGKDDSRASIKTSKSCETLARNFTKQSECSSIMKKPVFYKSSDDIDISVHIYEVIPDIHANKGIQKPNTHTLPARLQKFPSRKGPYLSKEALRAGYKYREPPPNPRKAQSKENVCCEGNNVNVQNSPTDKVCNISSRLGTTQQTRSTTNTASCTNDLQSKNELDGKATPMPCSNNEDSKTSTNSNQDCTSSSLSVESTCEQLTPGESKHAPAGTVPRKKPSKQYKHRPQCVQPSLPPKGQSSIHKGLQAAKDYDSLVCYTSSSDSSSTSEDMRSFLWSKGAGIEIPTKVGQAFGNALYDCQPVYQPLHVEGKASLPMYESLNKCSDLKDMEPRNVPDDESDGINAQNSSESQSKSQPRCHVDTGGYSHDSESVYMPLVPKRKKNKVIVEYESLHFMQQKQ